MTGSFTLVTQYFPPERGAAQVRLGSVVRQLAARGHRVEVVTALPNYPTGRIFPGWGGRPLRVEDRDGVRVRRVWVWAAMGSGAARLANYLSFALMSLVGLAGGRAPDWYVVEYPTLFGAVPAVVWARLRRRRVVVVVADLWVDTVVEVGVLPDGPVVAAFRRLERWMLRSADAVTAVTEGVRDRLLDKGVDPARMVWLPNGADVDLFRPPAGDEDVPRPGEVPEGHAVVLYAGTHGYVHGLDVVLDAAELLDGEPVVFLLVGDGSEKPRLVAEAAARGLANVVFRDPVDPEEVAELLRSSAAGLACVRGGDLFRTIRSAKMLPAMATCRPVIYSGDDEGSRLVASAGAGIVTPPGDAAALAAAVREVLADPDRAAEMGRAGREWVTANASWQRLVGDWLAQLAALDGGAGAGSAAAATAVPAGEAPR